MSIGSWLGGRGKGGEGGVAGGEGRGEVYREVDRPGIYPSKLQSALVERATVVL